MISISRAGIAFRNIQDVYLLDRVDFSISTLRVGLKLKHVIFFSPTGL